MLRGSRPGERRGGRKRDTPNRRTILMDRVLSIGLKVQLRAKMELGKSGLPMSAIAPGADTRCGGAKRRFGPISTKVHRSKKRRLLDHLVGGDEQASWYGQPESFRRF